MKHQQSFFQEFDIEEAKGQFDKKVIEAGTVDLDHRDTHEFSIEDRGSSNETKSDQTGDSTHVLEAKARFYIVCFMCIALLLLIICGVVISLMRNDNTILSVILNLVATSVGVIIGYFFGREKKS